MHVISTDEKTGIQALERAEKTRPAKAGKLEKREFEYIRHGTLCLTANFEVATGKIIAPTIKRTRTEDDFVEHLKNTIASDPCGEWVFVADNLNTHVSESLVRWVAASCGLDVELGKKGVRGVLKSVASRKAFLQEKGHRIRFVFTPRHASWLNQVEIWFSTLTRRLLRRGSFRSLEMLEARLLRFIEFFNDTFARPYKWTYTGRPLAA